MGNQEVVRIKQVKNRPIKDFRSGNIKASIWLNSKEVDGNAVEYKTISLSRSYKKKEEDIWRSEVINLRRGDIAKILVVLNEAQKELLLTRAEGDKND